MIYLKVLEKQEQAKSLTGRQKEIIKIKVKINEMATKRTTERINETELDFFDTLNKTEKSLAKQTKR
jgi:hypothetical protein